MLKKAKSISRDPLSEREEQVAVALRYEDAGMEAPIVSAVGRSELAQDLVRTARRYGVPVKRDGRLAARLSCVDTDEAIPVELYEDVARLLAKLDK